MPDIAIFAERMLPAVAAIVLTAILGWFTQQRFANANPVIWQIWQCLFARLVRKLDRAHRAAGTLRLRGAIVTGIVMLVAGLIGRGAYLLHSHWPLAGSMQVVLIALCLSVSQAWMLLGRVYAALRADQALYGAFQGLAVSTGYDLNSTDDHGCARVAIAYGVRMLDKGFVAPLFWFVFAGLPGLFAYTGLSALVWYTGRCGHNRPFYAVPCAIEYIAGIVPHMLAALMLVPAALVTPKTSVVRAVQALFARTGRASYYEGGLVLSIAAWALHVTLGGPIRNHAGYSISARWVGPANAGARIPVSYLKRAIYLSVMAHVICLSGLILLLIYL